MRGHSFLGILIADIAVEPLLSSVFGDSPQEVEFELYSGPVAETNRLNKLSQPAFALSDAYRAGLHFNYEILWYGQKWTMAFYPTPLFQKQSNRSRGHWTMAAGLLVTLALGGLVWVETSGRARAMEAAEDLVESRELLKESAAERARFSRNLHDGTIQSLYAIGLGLQRTRKGLAGQTTLESQLSESIRELDQVVSELRAYLMARSDMTEIKRTFGEALAELVRRWEQLFPGKLHVSIAPEAGAMISAPSAPHLLRICQEAFSNSLRHGQATTIAVRLDCAGECVRLEISDDGVGFDPTACRRPGHGLSSMAERAAELNWKLTIRSKPGGPTSVMVEVT